MTESFSGLILNFALENCRECAVRVRVRARARDQHLVSSLSCRAGFRCRGCVTRRVNVPQSLHLERHCLALVVVAVAVQVAAVAEQEVAVAVGLR